jgi:hypothetical protein
VISGTLAGESCAEACSFLSFPVSVRSLCYSDLWTTFWVRGIFFCVCVAGMVWIGCLHVWFGE